MKLTNEELLYGHDSTEHIVSVEVKDDNVILFKEINGKVEIEEYPMDYWILSAIGHSNMDKLKGDLFFDHVWKTDSHEEFKEKTKQIFKKRDQYWYPYNLKEMAILRDGFTMFKGLAPKDVSVLGFDIEAASLRFDDDSEVFCIANTLRKNGKITKKRFSLDEFKNSEDMIDCWSAWVRDMNPTFMCGHNIYTYDLPYMIHVMKTKYKASIRLGRDGSAIIEPKRPSQKRFDGSRSIAYPKLKIFGRELVDTWFLAMDYDAVPKKYENFRLKHIIEVEGLVKKGRIFYDAALIGQNWHIPEEREKIKKYCTDDGDDALALFDLMCPAYFYLTRSIPKTFGEVLVSASGSQINNLMIRTYLSQGHSIPAPDDKENFQGAFSYGKPGIYDNVFKIDVASLYPSIMRHFEIYSPEKDPLKQMLIFINIFTDERLKNKKIFKETDDPYYDALQSAQKIVINSFYGFLGAPGLHFNSMYHASKVTEHGRDILNHATDIFTGGEFYLDSEQTVQYRYTVDASEKKDYFNIVNADTDSTSFCKPNGKKFTDEECQELLDEIQEAVHEDFGPLINWEFDTKDMGRIKREIVLKTKNYAYTEDGKKFVFKGSSIKDQKVEKICMEFKKEILGLFLKKKQDQVFHLYHKYLRRVFKIGTKEEPITPWCVKKTITKAVLENQDKIALDVRNACKDKIINLEDKVYLYRNNEGTLTLEENYTGDHDPMHYVSRLYKSLKIFENILDIGIIPDYTLKNNKELLEEII